MMITIGTATTMTMITDTITTVPTVCPICVPSSGFNDGPFGINEGRSLELTENGFEKGSGWLVLECGGVTESVTEANGTTGQECDWF